MEVAEKERVVVHRIPDACECLDEVDVVLQRLTGIIAESEAPGVRGLQWRPFKADEAVAITDFVTSIRSELERLKRNWDSVYDMLYRPCS